MIQMPLITESPKFNKLKMNGEWITNRRSAALEVIRSEPACSCDPETGQCPCLDCSIRDAMEHYLELTERYVVNAEVDSRD